jgi:hypothetical protein
MIPFINDIDRLLQDAPSRFGEAYTPELRLSASAPAFLVALDATVSPSAIVFIASRVAMEIGPVEFATDTGVPLTVDGDVATLLPAAMVGPSCTVTVTQTWQGQQYVARQTVLKTLAFDASTPPAPSGLKTDGTLASIQLEWDPTNDANIGKVEVWRALADDLAAAVPVGETAGLARSYVDNIGAAGEFYYWLRYISKANIPGPFNAQAGTHGATGTDAGDLLDLLKNQISESQLLAALRDRINLIDATSDVAGSVAARIKAETDERIAALDQEIEDRLAALRGEAEAREAYVQDYTYSKVETDGALAIQAQEIAAAFTSYADQAAGQAVATAAADVRSYGYSRAAVDAAEAAQSTAITTAYRSYADGKKDEALAAAAADVRSYAYSKSGTDGAIGSLATTLRAEMASSGNVTASYVQNYTYSKAEFDSAQAGQSSALTTSYEQYADARKADAISASAADVRNYAYSKSDVDGGFATQFSTLTANYQAFAAGARDAAINAASADVRNYAYSKAGTDGAIASATETLQSTVGENTASIQAHQQSIDGLSVQSYIKTDVNGFISGYGVASDGVSSEFIVLASRFAFAIPGVGNKYPFIIGAIDGSIAASINGALIADDTISVKAIKATTVSALSANLGEVTAGIARNAGGDNYINFNARSGTTDTFLWVGNGAVNIKADGSGYTARRIVSPPDVIASGTVACDSNWVGNQPQYAPDGSVLSNTSGFVFWIDTGQIVNSSWSVAQSDMYAASATISGGLSASQGMNGYSSAEVYIGDGLVSGYNGAPFDNRIYIKFTWAPGGGPGAIRIQSISWKLVRL